MLFVNEPVLDRIDIPGPYQEYLDEYVRKYLFISGNDSFFRIYLEDQDQDVGDEISVNYNKFVEWLRIKCENADIYPASVLILYHW